MTNSSPTTMLAARFERLTDARRALQELENRGVDGVDLRLVGDTRVQARQHPTTAGPDRRMGRHVSRLVVRGMLLGAGLGLLAGIVLVLVGRALSDGFAEKFAVAALIVVGLGFLGWVVGTFLTFERGVAFSESWQATFDDVPDGASWVLVHDAAPDLEEPLRALGASEVVRSEGDRVPWRPPAGHAEAPEAGVAKDAQTLTDVLAVATARGFDSDFQPDDGARIRCLSCRETWSAGLARIERLHRLEGASDPADMLAVVTLSCPRCGARGTLVLNYGPESTPDHADVLGALEARPPAA